MKGKVKSSLNRVVGKIPLLFKENLKLIDDLEQTIMNPINCSFPH